MDSFAVMDGGGTSLDLSILSGGNLDKYKLGGINFLDSDLGQLEVDPFDVKDVFIYGSGIVSQDQKDKVVAWLTYQGVGYENLEINNDVLGSARSVHGINQGFAGILGTGAAACQYDGRVITSHLPSLGYIFGDHGGGVAISKQILHDYFHDRMPQEVRAAFAKEYDLTRSDFVKKIYGSPLSRSYLGSFARFLSTIDHRWKDELLDDQFTGYLQKCLNHFGESFQEISFVGSVAFHYQENLRVTAKRLGISIGQIHQSPMQGLIDYHLQDKQNYE